MLSVEAVFDPLGLDLRLPPVTPARAAAACQSFYGPNLVCVQGHGNSQGEKLLADDSTIKSFVKTC